MYFYCRCFGCIFIFKNKCDIEKYKSYYIKDDVYVKDGFKKFYKYEECKYEGCVYSKVINYFYCICVGCGFIFIFISQMIFYKCKYECWYICFLGVLGLLFLLLGVKDMEYEEFSNDDFVDFFVLSSKNFSLSVFFISQQFFVFLVVVIVVIEVGFSVIKFFNSKILGLLFQGLFGLIFLVLVFFNLGLFIFMFYFFILVGCGSIFLFVGIFSFLGVMLFGVVVLVIFDMFVLVVLGVGDLVFVVVVFVLVLFIFIMERIFVSKGFILFMMVRLVVVVFKFFVIFDLGSGQ